MKNLIFTSLLCITTYAAQAQTNSDVHYQEGYYKPSSGAYVQPHYKTNSNSTNHDNFSTSGNTNPYTGDKGYRAKDYSSEAYNYGRGQQTETGTGYSSGSNNYGGGQQIETGPRGGQYYINSRGNKTYVPKRQ